MEARTTAGLELILESLLDLSLLLPLLVLLLGLLGSLLVDESLLGLAQFRPLLVSEREGVVRLEPLPERRRVDDDDGVLDDGLGAHQLIVARVVDDVDDPGLAGDGLAAPREVALVEAEGAELLVAAAHAHPH